jgi:hypothetical protein
LTFGFVDTALATVALPDASKILELDLSGIILHHLSLTVFMLMRLLTYFSSPVKQLYMEL